MFLKDRNSQIIKKKIEERNGTIRVVNSQKKVFEICLNNKKFYVHRTFSIFSSSLAIPALSRNKNITGDILMGEKINTPKTLYFDKYSNIAEISSKTESLKLPLILKEIDGSQSRGIISNIKSIELGLVCIENKLKAGKEIIIQEKVEGKEYRLLFLKDKIIAGLEMTPPVIIGDAKHTIKELIKQKYSNRQKKIKFDNALEDLLFTQKCSLNSVLEKDVSVFIKYYPSLECGGKSKDITQNIHPSFINICQRTVKSCGLRFAGIDIICEDIKKDINEQNYYIIDINNKPDLYIHYDPSEGKRQDVVEVILDYLESDIL